MDGTLCTFDVRRQPFGRVVDTYVQPAAEREITIPNDVRDGEVTLRVRNMRWRDALDELADRVDCVVREDGEALRILRLPPEEWEERRAVTPDLPQPWAPESAGPGTVTLDVVDGDLDSALDAVRAATEMNVVISPPLAATRPRLSLRVVGVPWQQALLSIADQVDGIVRSIGSEVLRIEIRPPEPQRNLARVYWDCVREGERFRTAEKQQDFLRMAVSRRAFRAAVADLDRAILEFPEKGRSGGERDEAYADRNLKVLRRVLGREFRDLLGE